MRRQSDDPRTLTEKVEDAHRRLDDLARRQGKGAAAIRDRSGSVIEMNGNSPVPLLTPIGMDSAVGFTPDGRVSVLSETGEEYRDFRARVVNATGSIGSDNNVVAANFLIGAGLSVDGMSTSGGFRSTASVNADVSVGANQNVVAVNAVIDRLGDVRTASEFRVKEHLADLDGAASERFLLGLRPARFRFNPDIGAALVPTGPEWHQDGTGGWYPANGDVTARLEPDTTVHVGIYVDEAAAGDPDTVRVRGDGYRTYEDRSMIAHLIATVNRQSGRIAELERQVAELNDSRS